MMMTDIHEEAGEMTALINVIVRNPRMAMPVDEPTDTPKGRLPVVPDPHLSEFAPIRDTHLGKDLIQQAGRRSSGQAGLRSNMPGSQALERHLRRIAVSTGQVIGFHLGKDTPHTSASMSADSAHSAGSAFGSGIR